MSSEDDGFNSKNWVWVPVSNHFFSKGYVTDYLKDGKCEVVLNDGNKETSMMIESNKLQNCNPSKFNKCNDMAELTHLNEPSVVYNLFLRYTDDLIYTYSGLFLVAINPYKPLPIYDEKVLKNYRNNGSDRPLPHIFSTAEDTYRNLVRNKKDQSILVTGESGAGKTENTKRIIQYLSSVTADHGKNGGVTDIDDKILKANPILESFGNAKTIKNNNSSRFGKFIKIFFSHNGILEGANINYYLLEKSRVVSQIKEERNYHIFYQFIKGSDEKRLSKYRLVKDANCYNYLKGAIDIANMDDAKDYGFMIEAFRIVGFSEANIDDLFSMLAAILHLGNLDFNSWKSEQATFKKGVPLDIIANLLGVPRVKLEETLLKPKVKAGKEYVQKSKKPPEVKYSVDAIAKLIYEKVFQYVIDRINNSLRSGNNEQKLDFIGVLDIAGFEIFQQNSFEQLCINYTNEKLQQFFNHHSFILEQSEYLKEDIQWEFMDFGKDLQPTIDLIETKKPMGIFETLNEECKLPKTTDKSFMEKLASNWGKGQSAQFKQNRLRNGFIVKHYAGLVEYNVDGWLQKNTDPVNENILQLLAESNQKFVKNLFEEQGSLGSENLAKTKTKTISLKHKEQLCNLMDQLELTEPHFVRCIIPNLEKKANTLDKSLVLNQLRCNGVLEGIRITRAGYPNRMTFEEFNSRYSILNKTGALTKNAKTNSELIFKNIDLDADSYKIGITKIFFKNGILGKLEELRVLRMKNIFTGIQRLVRGKVARLVYKSKIAEIQAAQVIKKNFLLLSNSFASSSWLSLFLNLKPHLADSVKMLDNKSLNDDLNHSKNKLMELERVKGKLEGKNQRFEGQLKLLENEVTSNVEMLKSKDELIKKLEAAEKQSKAKLGIAEDDLQNLKNQVCTLKEEKMKVEESMQELFLKEKTKSEELEQVNNRFLEVSSTVEELKSTIDHLQKQLRQRSNELERSEVNHRNSKEKSDLDTTKLSDENENLKCQLKNLQEKSRDLEPDNKTLRAEIEHLKSALRNSEVRVEESKASRLQQIKESDESNRELHLLKSQLFESEKIKEKLHDELTNLGGELDENKKKVSSFFTREKDLENIINNLQLRELGIKEQLIEKNKKLEDLERIRQNFYDLSEEHKSLASSFEALNLNHEVVVKAKSSLSNELVVLNNKIKELEKATQEREVEKENRSPQATYVEDYANMKHRLNEQSAFLRKEKLENRKLYEELSQVKNKNFKNSSASETAFKRKSLALGEESQTLKSSVDCLKDEITSLKSKMEQEQTNSQRAENYAIELQKKLNNLQATRGLQNHTDFEQKYKDSQSKVEEMERHYQELINRESPQVPVTPLARSDSFWKSSNSSGFSRDFAKIYQDLTQTLRVTRDELSGSKSEILRLKKILRDSEDELYTVKHASFRSSVSKYEDELAQVQVKTDTLAKRNEDLSSDLEFYKKRSEEYYGKLELAESAVNTSRRYEKEAQKELLNIKNQFKLTQEEARTTQILLRDIRKQNSDLEEKINDNKFEKGQLEKRINELNDKFNYYNNTYGNKELNENYKEEIQNLSKELNFKMETEVSLIKENKRLQLESEDLSYSNKSLDSELKDRINKVEKLEQQNLDLFKKLRVLDNEKVIHERKINNLSKQIASLKDLNSEVSKQRDELKNAKEELEEKVDDLYNTINDKSSLNDELQSSLNILRDHLENQRKQSEEMKDEFSRSMKDSDIDMEDYKKTKREKYFTDEENESLRRVNGELNRKVSSLEEKLYSNEHLQYWQSKVLLLNDELDESHNENHKSSKMIKSLEREIKLLQMKIEKESVLTKKYNDENFNFQNKINHWRSTIDILQNENEEKDLLMKSMERESRAAKENNLALQREILELKEKLTLPT